MAALGANVSLACQWITIGENLLTTFICVATDIVDLGAYLSGISAGQCPGGA